MYQSKRVGETRIAVSAEFDDKYKTYLLTFTDGKTQTFSSSTFKRWWKEVPDDDQYVKEVMEQKEALGIEIPPITEVEVVKEETTEVKGDNKALLVDMISTNYPTYTIKTYEGALKNYIVIKNGKKALMELVVCKKWVNVRVKAHKLEGIPHKTLNNYYLPAEVKYSYDDIKNIITLLKEEN